MTTIGILGATGGTGQQVIAVLRDRRIRARALVRNAEALAAADGLEVVVGDACDVVAVERTLAGCDAVICTLGLAKGTGTSISEATEVLIKSMEAGGPRRLVVVTVNGLNDSKATAGFFGKVIIPVLLKERFADRARQDVIVRLSDLDVTVVRPTRLMDGEATGEVRIGTTIKTGMSSNIRRADLATTLVDLALDGRFTGEAVTVTAGT